MARATVAAVVALAGCGLHDVRRGAGLELRPARADHGRGVAGGYGG
jgi:UDP-3-O-acyl-N-acetylglucosamine deacetylase